MIDHNFQQQEANYFKQLPAEFSGAKLLVDLQGRTDQLPDWQRVAEFEAFLLREGAALRSKAHEPLRYLATQTGWFTPDEISTSVFEWLEVLFLHDSSELTAKAGGGLVYELQFSMESYGHPWVDVYGAWIVTFNGSALTGLRREQR